MGSNIFDIIIFIVFGLSCAFGFYKGSIRLIIGFICFLGSLVLTTLIFPVGAIIIAHYVKHNVLANIINGITCYIISIVIFAFISKRLINFAGELSGNIVDRIMGLGLGAIRGIFFATLIFGIIAIIVSDSYIKVDNAKEMIEKIDGKHLKTNIKS